MSNFSFDHAPVLKRSRASFDLSHTLFTGMNVGSLYPVLVQEVYPGDQFNIHEDGVLRNAYPFIKPIMDNIFFDCAYFFVPYRTICDEWENCITGGSAEPNDWDDPEDVDIPTYSSGKVVVGSVLDYLGIPSDTSPIGVSVLPARAFAKIWNEWFRDENTQDSCNIIKNGLGASEVPNGNAWSATNYVGMLPPVNKLHDYFTTALRGTQKGTDVTFGFGKSFYIGDKYSTGFPVVFSNDDSVTFGLRGSVPLRFYSSGSGLSSGYGSNLVGSYPRNSVYVPEQTYEVVSSPVSAEVPSTAVDIIGSNMVADTSGSVLSVNDLRYGFALQKILERSARSGSRYSEYIASAFGVSPSDARLQRSEYLGGSSTPVNIQQVASTFGEEKQGGNTSLGELGAYSLTNNKSRSSKAFTEHGYIIGVSWLRQFHTYSQGVEKFLRRKSRFDFYDPSLMNIGEQPVYLTELYNGTSYPGLHPTIFGYQEAWADLRYRPNRVSGLLRPKLDNEYSYYTLSDNYASSPTLSSSFISETPSYVWRAMGVVEPSKDMCQFIVDFRFNIKAIRELPTYSVPSLIDHN